MYKDSEKFAGLGAEYFVVQQQISPMAKALWDNSEDELDYVVNVLEFINDNVEYQPDLYAYHAPLTGWFFDWMADGSKNDPKADFAKYPFQTLLDGNGDCEDFSVLFSSFMAYAQIQTGIAYSDNHAASAIAVYSDKWNGASLEVLKTLGDDTDLTTTTFDAETSNTLSASKDTSISELEEILRKDVPKVFGRRTQAFLAVPEAKSLKDNSHCQDKWLGDLLLTVEDSFRIPSWRRVRKLTAENTLADILFDSRKHLKEIKQVTRRDQIIYILPNMPRTFLVSTASMAPGDFSCYTAEALPTLATGVVPPGFSNGKEEAKKIDKFKYKEIFYVEPQKKGFIVHDRMPKVVKTRWISQGKYRKAK